jgi:membrane-associated phospholipid phosphatase
MGNRRVLLFILIWLGAIFAAAMCDRAVAMQVRAAGIESFFHAHKLLRESLKMPGFYPFTIVVAIALTFLHPLRWRAGVTLLLFTLVAGLNEPIKWIVGRARPFKSLTGEESAAMPFDLHPFPALASKNLCFPSGHAALAFATAACLAMLLPRFRWWFYLGATIVGLERIAENAHWTSDVAAAAALGIGGVWAIRQLLQRKKITA